MSEILVITTGGTINADCVDDPVHIPKISTFHTKDKNRVYEAISALTSVPSRLCSLPPIDSKNMDTHYRQNILTAIEQAPERSILITHGTDTLLETADFLYQQLKNKSSLQNKLILITGAMMPLANGIESDGYLNLKFSVAQFEKLSTEKNIPAVFIVLCDLITSDPVKPAVWQPRLYYYQPRKYKKIHTEDSRYNRLITI